MNKKRYLLYFFTMFSGTALAQVINFASYPVLTRTYSATDMGALALFIATASIFGAVANGRFDAVIQAAKHSERFAAFAVGWLFARATGAVATLAYAIFLFFTKPTFDYWLPPLLGLSILANGYVKSATIFLQKHKKYRESAFSFVVRTALTALPQIILFYVFPNEIGLISGFVLGASCQALYLHQFIHRKLKWRKSTTTQRALVFKKYKQYLYVDVPSSFLSLLSLHILNYFLLLLFSKQDVGYYSISYRLAALPVALISSALSQVFFQQGAESFRTRGVFWNEFKFNLGASSALSLFIYVVAALLARPAIRIYLGEDWMPAADVFLVLAPMLGVRLVAATIASMPLIIGKPYLLFWRNLSLLLAMIISATIAAQIHLSLLRYLLVNSLAVGAVELGFAALLTHLTFHNFRILDGKTIDMPQTKS